MAEERGGLWIVFGQKASQNVFGGFEGFEGFDAWQVLGGLEVCLRGLTPGKRQA